MSKQPLFNYNNAKFDERQLHIRHKAYQISFWSVILLLWFYIVSHRVIGNIITGDSIVFTALLLCISVFNSYCSAKGASPFVDQRFGRIGRYIPFPTFILALIIISMAISTIVIYTPSLKTLLALGGEFNFLCLGLSLLSTSVSIIYGQKQFCKDE